MEKRVVLITLVAAVSASACTSEQLYATGQGWQRYPCSRIPDKTEYDRCMRDADITYDSYKREIAREHE
jgi:hypothetical protein